MTGRSDIRHGLKIIRHIIKQAYVIAWTLTNILNPLKMGTYLNAVGNKYLNKGVITEDLLEELHNEVIPLI